MSMALPMGSDSKSPDDDDEYSEQSDPHIRRSNMITEEDVTVGRKRANETVNTKEEIKRQKLDDDSSHHSSVI